MWGRKGKHHSHHHKSDKKAHGDGAPKVVEVKEVVFIRHGHSLGQAAPRETRRVDESLRDADLSPHGLSQAQHLAKMTKALRQAGHGPELVMCSPLTRAMKTALILFDEEPVVVHPGLAELNHRRPIPENNGRPLKELLKDEALIDLGLGVSDRINTDLVEALNWPNARETNGLSYLSGRMEKRIVIVSHHNFILSQLRDHFWGGVENCDPIHTIVTFEDGHPRVELHAMRHAWFCDSSLEDKPIRLALHAKDEHMDVEDSDIYQKAQ